MAATIRIVVETSGGVDAVKKDLSSLGSTAQGAGGGFSSLREVATGALREIGSLAVNALGQAASAVGGFLKDSIGAAGDFQSGMLEFQAVAGKGVDTAGLEQFKDLFISLGKELPVSTADVQKAAIELVKGGIDPATVSAGGLKQTIQFAAAAMGGDLVAAAEVSAKVVGGWADVTATAQEKADLLTHSTDLLTKAANASTVDVHDLALGLYNVQGTAKTMGLSLDETTTVLAELAPRFSSANTAGTSLRNMLVRLQPQTKSQTGMMEDLGLYTEETGSKFFDANGKFVGVAKASELLKNSLAGLTDQQKTEALQTIFGNDAMNAAAALADMGADGYNNMTAALNNANGVQANAELKQQGLNTAMDNFKGSVEALQITVGTALLPVLTDLFNNVLAPAVNTVTSFADAVFKTGDPIGTLAGMIDTFIPGFSVLVTWVQQAVTDFFGLDSKAQDVSNALAAFGGKTAVVQQQVSQFAQIIQDVTAVVQSIFQGVLVPAFQEVLSVAQNVFGIINQYIPYVMQTIQEVIGAVMAQVLEFWEKNGADILKFASETWNTIKETINDAVELIMLIVIGTFKAVADFINQHGAAIQTILGGAWQVIKGLIDGALAIIKGIISAALAIIKGDWEGAWNIVKETLARLWEDIKGIISGALDIIAGFFGTSLDKIKATWQGAWDGLKAIVTETDWAAVGQGVIDGIVNGVSNAAHHLAEAAANAAKDALQAAKDALGISSPSKVFAKEVGFPMAQGMAVGLTRGAPMVAHAGAASAQAAVAGATTYNNYTLNFAPNYGGQPSERMDYRFAKSLAGVA